MIVIRIENNSNGKGIFQENGIDFYDLDYRHSSMRSARHINGFTLNHYCAYKSLKDLEKWVLYSEIKKAFKIGYSVYAITLKKKFLNKDRKFVSTYIVDDDQVVFLKKGIKKKIDISYLIV